MNFSNFCEELRAKSNAIHAKSDKLVQLKLAVALTNIKLYQQVLCDFHSVFKAIEDGINKNQSHPYILKVWKKDLSRTNLIEKDLDFYVGLGWKNILQPSHQAREYETHIHIIAENEPELLLAYIHTMYLGKVIFILCILENNFLLFKYCIQYEPSNPCLSANKTFF